MKKRTELSESGKKLVSRITEEEFNFVQNECKRLAAPNLVRFELSKNSITVYSAEKMDFTLFGIPMCYSKKKADDQSEAFATYMPSLRFSIEDEKKREFPVERMSFMGDEEEWYFLESGSLKKLIKKYAPHIEKESMFDFL